MRRAQIEMMGLVVIVILVTIGIFFSVAFKQPTTETPTSQVFEDEHLPGRFLIVLLSTNVPDCPTGRSVTLQDIAIDCIRAGWGDTYATSYYACGEPSSCDQFKAVTSDLFGDTLTAWGRNYNFTFYNYDPTAAPGDPPTVMMTLPANGNSCNDVHQESSQLGDQLIPLTQLRRGSGKIRFTLKVC